MYVKKKVIEISYACTYREKGVKNECNDYSGIETPVWGQEMVGMRVGNGEC